MTIEQVADIFWPIYQQQVADRRDLDPDFIEAYDEQVVRANIMTYPPYREALEDIALLSGTCTLTDVAELASAVLDELYEEFSNQ